MNKPKAAPTTRTPKTKLPLHSDVKLIPGKKQSPKALSGGMTASYPKLNVPVGSSRWVAIMDYLIQYQPNNKLMLHKVSKMLNRFNITY